MPQQEVIQGPRPSIYSFVDTPQRIPPSLDYNGYQSPFLDALRFSSRPENIILPNNEELICSDDRWENTEGKIARFGGSGGLVLGLLAINKFAKLGFSPEQIVNGTVNATKGKFNIHTDIAALTTDYGIGCGHLAKAMLPGYAEKYGIDFEDVVQAVSYMKHLVIELPEKVKMHVVPKVHGAKAVLLNLGETKLNHCDADRQFYVVDVKREKIYLEEFYPRLLEQVPQLKNKGITLEHFVKVLDLQRDATARILAEGMPIFKINLDNNPELPYIEKAGFVK